MSKEMMRDIIIALVIGLAFVIPYDGPRLIGAILVAAGSWYLLVGTHESKKTRTTP